MTTPIDAKQMMMLLTPIATLTGYASSVESGANTTRWSESLLKHGKEAEVALDKLMDIFLGMMDVEAAKAPPVPAAHEGLREVLEFYAEAWTFKTNERYGGLEWSPMERLLDDCGNRAKDAIATLDAIITVQALNMSADHVQKPGNIEHVNTHQPDELSRTIECILFQHFSNCLAGTDFKDDPKKQKYMDAAKEVMRYVAKQPARESGSRKCDLEMERVKACEHIAEGDMEGNDWRILRNICPSTMAVAKLRDEYEIMRDVLKMLSKRQIATWYSRNEDPNAGYYAGWDDAEYAIKKALAGENWKATTQVEDGAPHEA